MFEWFPSLPLDCAPALFIVVKSISTQGNLIFRKLFTLIWWWLIQGKQLSSVSGGLVKTIPLNWLLVGFFFNLHVFCIIFFSVWIFFLCKSPANCNSLFKICLEIPFLKKACPNSNKESESLPPLSHLLPLNIDTITNPSYCTGFVWLFKSRTSFWNRS